MIDLEMLKQMRAAGVKHASFDGDGISSVEFFPLSVLEVSEFAAGAADPDGTETERPPPDEDGPPNLPPAFARILGKQSVS